MQKAKLTSRAGALLTLVALASVSADAGAQAEPASPSQAASPRPTSPSSGAIAPSGPPVTPMSPMAAPSGEDRWWEHPPLRSENESTGAVLRVVGGGLAGLGGLGLLGASITWLVAAGERLALNNECYDKICYEDSPGGDTLVRARDAERAAGIVFGLSVPVLATGLVLVLVGSGLKPQSNPTLRVAPVVGPKGSGLTMEARF
jgi:hypothetical protein